MKGVIFSEMVRWMEEAFSPAIADRVINQSAVASDGAYTSVGNYPHGEALSLLVQLSQQVSEPVGELARRYGRWLAGRFVILYPELVGVYSDARTFLAHVESHIHLEVRKIYTEANPPNVIAEKHDGRMKIEYASHRPFADVAHGLIEGFIVHFGEDLTVVRESIGNDGTAARFWIDELEK